MLKKAISSCNRPVFFMPQIGDVQSWSLPDFLAGELDSSYQPTPGSLAGGIVRNLLRGPPPASLLRSTPLSSTSWKFLGV